jgi:hypothetical protein
LLRREAARWAYSHDGAVFHGLVTKTLDDLNWGGGIRPVLVSLPAGELSLRLTLTAPGGKRGSTLRRLRVDAAPEVGPIEVAYARPFVPPEGFPGLEALLTLGSRTVLAGSSVMQAAEPNLERGNFRLSIANAVDQDGSITGVRWFFGDGSTATGLVVDHHWALPGAYAWPGPDGAGQPAGKKQLGRLNVGKAGISYGFETIIKVLGNPKKCTGGQVLRAEYSKVFATSQTTSLKPQLGVNSPKFATDGPDNDFRQTSPGADGIGEVAFYDGANAGDVAGLKAAQMDFEVIDYLTGVDADKEGKHEDKETEPPPDQKGSGETAFIQFKVCIANVVPAGQKDFNFENIAKGEPDASEPDVVKPANRDDRGQGVANDGKGFAELGCGKKT